MIDYHKLKSVIAVNEAKRDMFLRTVREIVEGMDEEDRQEAEVKIGKLLTNYIRRVGVDRVGIVTNFLCERAQVSNGMVLLGMLRKDFHEWCEETGTYEVGRGHMIRIIHQMGYPSYNDGSNTHIVGLILNSGEGTRPGVVGGKVKRGRPKGSKNKPKEIEANPAE